MHSTRPELLLKRALSLAAVCDLIRAAKALDTLTLSTEQDMGVNIIRRAVEEPLRMISKNAGVEGSIVVQNIKENAGSYGYNAATSAYGDMFEFGVIDPTKVVRHALRKRGKRRWSHDHDRGAHRR